MSDLITRLTKWVHDVDAVSASDLMDEAAEVIVRLNVEVSTLIAECQKLQDRCVNGNSEDRTVSCPICDQKPANCDCTAAERRQYSEIEDLQDEIARLRLADVEKKAIEYMMTALAGQIPDGVSETLRSLLARLETGDEWTSQEMVDARAEIALLRDQRNHWMSTARAFDDHLATFRVMLLEQPGMRFGAVDRVRLTDAERAAIADAADRYSECVPEAAETAATLRSLLKRTEGE